MTILYYLPLKTKELCCVKPLHANLEPVDVCKMVADTTEHAFHYYFASNYANQDADMFSNVE